MLRPNIARAVTCNRIFLAMPNTLTLVFTSTPSAQPVESPHPNTGVYATGTQQADGTWVIVHTLVAKTSSPPTLSGRLRNSPAISTTILATGNVVNNVLPTPTTASTTANGTAAINVAIGTVAGVTAYLLLGATTQAGPYAQLYSGTTPSFTQAGLSTATGARDATDL